MVLLLKLWKNKKLLKALGALFLVAALAFSLIHYGENRAEQRIQDEITKSETVTREKVRGANEDIRSSDDFIIEWLRDNNRFRD